MLLQLIITIAAGYLLGNLNGSVLISRLAANDDVRAHGSGNAGFTNFYRSYGGLKSLLVILIDGLKAAAACLIGWLLLKGSGYGLEGRVLGAIAVTLGHDFPAFLGFKGGKGIVCGFISVLCIDWRIGLILLGIFALLYFPTKLVSLASVGGSLALIVCMPVFHHGRPLATAGTILLAHHAIFMHRENLVRLLGGKERKTHFIEKKK